MPWAGGLGCLGHPRTGMQAAESSMIFPEGRAEQGGNQRNVVWPCVVIGMTGSVSVALMPQALLVLRQVAGEVHVLMSRAATRFATTCAVQLYSGQPVRIDDEEADCESPLIHIELIGRANVFLIMPATANMLAKAAHGICDDVISTAIIAARGPIVFVPSMNEAMWKNPAIEDAVSLLRTRGHRVIEPTWGREISNLSPNFGVMPGIEAVIAELASLRFESR